MRRVFLAVVAVALAGRGTMAEEAGPATFDFGPVASRRVDVDYDLRLQALGPLFETARSADGKTLLAVRPFYATAADPATERTAEDYLWPLGSAKSFRRELWWRFLLFHGLRFDTPDPESRYRVWLLPFYFQGRDVHGERYAAVFPVGGKVHEFLGRDRATFVLFPLWLKSSVNRVETWDVLWPFISRTKGKGIYRFRIFPFYGQSKHRNRFQKRFIMWPIWSWARYTYEDSSGSGYILFPLWGHIRLTNQESWMFLPPLFRFHRGARLNYVHAPWPFFQKSSGEVEKLYLWPLWGSRTTRGVKSQFLLWPFFWRTKLDRGKEVSRRLLAVPFYFSEVRHTRPEAGGAPAVTYRHHKLWPLASYQREGDARRVRLLELWPLRRTAPVERSWAPLWTVFRHVVTGNASETEVLWGLCRHARRGDLARSTSLFPLFEWRRDDGEERRREWSVLKGLVGYQRRGDSRSVRLLYLLRIGGAGSHDDGSAKESGRAEP